MLKEFVILEGRLQSMDRKEVRKEGSVVSIMRRRLYPDPVTQHGFRLNFQRLVRGLVFIFSFLGLQFFWWLFALVFSLVIFSALGADHDGLVVVLGGTFVVALPRHHAELARVGLVVGVGAGAVGFASL